MELAIQTGSLIDDWGAKEAYRMLAEAGFKSVDWSIGRAWDRKKIKAGILAPTFLAESVDAIMEHYREEMEEMRKNGIWPNQIHAPFPAYVPNFPELEEYVHGIYVNCIRFCEKIGVKYMVVHGISLMMDDYTQTPETIREMNHRLYESLIPVLQETNVVVCLENLFTEYKGMKISGTCCDPAEVCAYIDRFNEKAGREAFGFCLDSGHLNLLGIRPDVFIRGVGSRIKVLHLHDNNGVEDEHMAPYTGKIIWRDLIGALREVGYCGELGFETARQMEKTRLDKAIVPVYLKTIHDIGRVFSDIIEA